MTIHETKIGNKVFYINRKKDNTLNYNSVGNLKFHSCTTHHYKSAVHYYKALTKAKKLLNK
tara:strand:+ start:2159 stop:2341 length:183 start_codon:yes stop_codon:yes gene_type:complete